MIAAGASPKAVQTVLGHANAGFTLSVYGHMFDADLDDLAIRLDEPRNASRSDLSPPARGLHSIDHRARRAAPALTCMNVVGPGGIEPPTEGL